jgi:D,D-heptose 1,7-bisphosphate phosphatase
MAMRAIILAGGKGSRLAEITRDEIPKGLVPLCGKPILQHQIETLKKNEISNITIIVGYLGGQILNCLGDGRHLGVKIDYIVENKPLGTAGALFSLKDSLLEDFLVLCGDIMFDVDLQRMVERHTGEKAMATLFLHPNTHPYDSDLVEVDESNKVIKLHSKNNPRVGFYRNLVNSGIYMFSPRVFTLDVLQGTKLDLEKDILLRLMARQDKVLGYISPEYVKDAGVPGRLLEIEQDMQRGIVTARNLQNKQKCIFLDRDGTINKYAGFVYNVDQFVLEAGVTEAIKLVNDAGYLAVVITNQPVVARGLCSYGDVVEIHKKMETLLGEAGVYLDGIRFCPHHPDKGYLGERPEYKKECTCRKPQTGMLLDAAASYNIDLTQSWFIGDQLRDVQTGVNAGMKTVLVGTGGEKKDGKYSGVPDFKAPDLLTAVKTILGRVIL